jgi:hypothetical protein
MVLNSVIGRRAATGYLKRPLEAHRAVTLTGPGGVGKTRLTRHVAAEALSLTACDSRSWTTSSTLCQSTMPASLGLRNDDGTPIGQSSSITSDLCGCYYCSTVATIGHSQVRATSSTNCYARTPRLRMLSTSRRPFHNAGCRLPADTAAAGRIRRPARCPPRRSQTTTEVHWRSTARPRSTPTSSAPTQCRGGGEDPPSVGRAGCPRPWNPPPTVLATCGQSSSPND